ncbi:MAG TPA: helix-turn-helix transcriptional regulator [Candidatus Sulfomarinibacteraceae bacterium]|nr:helix-turn-helix transcriptional regulator [Candidatus Sulfomarinibacteraceae bacterium]
MDGPRIGRSLRALRIRRRRRQADVAATAGISRTQYGRIERGDLQGVPIADLQSACTALGADLDIRVRWHGEGLDRLLDAAHAELVNQVVRLLVANAWESAVEVSFNHFGDRGSVDVLGWKGAARALLIVEAKSTIPDAQSTIESHDRKTRLATVIGRSRGWEPDLVGRLLVVADSSTARRRVGRLADLFGAAYPDGVVAVRRWLRAPVGWLNGLVFLPIAQGDGTRIRAAARERVQRPRKPRNAGE